ncbi:MAG: DEAD/DEAH box helicase family protein, partial [Sphaerochaeta sp.]
MAHTLYQWQTECIEGWFTHQGRGVVQVVTGAGKTILALHAALALQHRLAEDLHIVIVVPKKFMLNQWKNTILSELPIRRDEIGFVGGGYSDKHQYKVMLYVVNSARSRLSLPLYNHLMNDKPLLLIADECHHYTSEENRKIFAFLDALPNEKKENYSCLGLSATPKKGELEKYLGPLFYSYSFTEAIAHNVINRVAIFNVGLRLDAKQAK